MDAIYNTYVHVYLVGHKTLKIHNITYIQLAPTFLTVFYPKFQQATTHTVRIISYSI